MFSFSTGVRSSSTAISSQHLAISSQHLLGLARAHQAMGNLEEAKKSYAEAVNKAKTEHEKKPADLQAKKAFDAIRNEFFTFLSGLQEPAAAANVGEHSPTSPIPNPLHSINRNNAATQRPLSAQRALDASLALSNAIKPDFFEKCSSLSELVLVQTVTPTEEKSGLVEYLFEKALSTLGSLEIANKPSLFLVYAHDNPDPKYGQAEAYTSKYLIEKLSNIRGVNLYSDQTPMGQTYSSSTEELKEDGKLEDILTNQLCLLPARLRNDVKPVNKVVVCCSEVLGRYLEWSHYEDFYQELRAAYLKDCEQQGSSAIREVVKKFSQEQKYKAGFHHVLTEIAFLQIRAEHWQDQHGIIPVSLTPNSYEQCLAHFIPATTVRMEDMPRLDAQTKAGEVYPNQSRHGVLFKLIERVLVNSDEAQTFLNKFWQGYNECISRLSKEPSMPGKLEFIKLVDSIFDDIDRELRSQLLQVLQQHKNIVGKLRPPNLSDLRGALYQHYQRSNLSIQRISGQTVSLDDCYINLAIVESQAQREKDKEELKKQAKIFERLPSSERLEATNQNKLIPLDQLFEKQKLRDGSENVPRRILIQGRAGIGKTTLCKKLVDEYYRNGLWQDLFDNILWVPLRQLKTASFQHLENLLCNRYFSNHGSAKALGKLFREHQDKTLFILDGLDEVTEMFDQRHPLNHFLTNLLNQSHVLITSRPAGINASQCNNPDLELETIGFSPDNVQAYIQKFTPASNQTEIQQFIHRMPLIQGLVNIPIQLDALCYSWDRLPQNREVTMSMLYEAMVDKLWRKDSVRLEKKEKDQLLGIDVIEDLSESDLEELMTAEIHYLSYLAFKGLETEKIEFSREELSQRRKELNARPQTGEKLPLHFTTNLKKTSYLHTADVERPESERHYHFLHLTFQEFFAAKFLVEHLQAYAKVESASAFSHVVQKGLSAIPSRNELEAFIATHKYNPRYEIVWWMVAGLLKDTALEHFFNVLDQSPRDLIGMRHQQVIMGCLNEARSQLTATPLLAQLEDELMQWLNFEMENGPNYYSRLGSQRTFPEHLLLDHPDKSRYKLNIIKTLGERSVLSDGAIEFLGMELEDGQQEDPTVIQLVVMALTGSEKLPAAIIEALGKILKLQNKLGSLCRQAVTDILYQQDNLPEPIEQSLLYQLEVDDRYSRVDEDEGPIMMVSGPISLGWRYQMSTADGFGARVDLQEKLPEADIEALIETLRNGDINIESTAKAARTLGQQRELSDFTIDALITALKDNRAHVRYAVADILFLHKKLDPKILQVLLETALQDEERKIRRVAIEALGQQETLPEFINQVLIAILNDEDRDARYIVVRILRQRKELSASTIDTLLTVLQDGKEDARSAAAEVLDSHTEELYQSLARLTSDEDKFRSVYFNVFSPHSCKHIAPLYIQDNQLYFYTAAGLGQPIQLTAKQNKVITEAFKTVQAEAK
ncbi:NACHT domain-containing NTPase [Mycoavidus sp. SF9855]|uniref:NACHT domain-containing protein n=1 Tax=Mycoavidus sp. SF9855 TaxID=2968475 RepID=UPI00211BE6AF|nr:NACHT domain-containing protein [Mycoavidus sp. SF9855]UUM22297.1 NACHT domain-containing protein [Mycoavidus sp. SF9855]